MFFSFSSEEFITFLTYCRDLDFDERPDYTLCKNLFKNLNEKCNFAADHNFDWTLKIVYTF